MGIGNITELTAADTTGVNALLVAICEEVGVRAVLTTEVIPWARGAVREIDIARRLMHHAVTRQALPKGVDRSEEHTSELQSRLHLVCRLLLEKKKQNNRNK